MNQRKLIGGVVAGLVLGIAANLLARGAGGWSGFPALDPAVDWIVRNISTPIGQIFLRLLFMLVVPLLFSALVVGVAALDLRSLGRVGAKMLGYTVVMSLIAVLIGITLVNVLQPGAGISEQVRALARQGTSIKAAAAPSDAAPVALLVAMFPDNPVKAAANGDMIGLIVFALLFGLALAVTPGEPAARLREMLEGLYEVLMTFIGGVLRFAPVGVGALLFTLGARIGVAVVGQLLTYVGVVVLGLAIHQFGVYSISVRWLSGQSPRAFFRDVRLAMVTAFSTASSSATLPTALRVAEENLKLPPQIARFVLTAGSAMNQNGTALFEGVTVLFLAQVFGVHLSLAQQFMVMFVCVLGGIGTAGVPAGSIPVVAMILGMVGIPPEGLGLVLGVDRILDMCRTTVNVTGDLAAAVYIAATERPVAAGARAA